MKHLKKFNEIYQVADIFDEAWKNNLPKKLIVYYGDKEIIYEQINAFLNIDLFQIIYENVEVGSPDYLELDISFITDTATNKKKVGVDITYGELMACEFSILSNKISKIEDMTRDSEYNNLKDKISFHKDSVDEFILFLNGFDFINLNFNDLKFLSYQK